MGDISRSTNRGQITSDAGQDDRRQTDRPFLPYYLPEGRVKKATL
jgi:hypothetical protein